jgi:hypothetical protein
MAEIADRPQSIAGADTADELADVIDVVLEGGPATFPAEWRSHRVPRDQEKMKIRHYGGYEHFERVATPDRDDAPVVFRWIGRTRIAE